MSEPAPLIEPPDDDEAAPAAVAAIVRPSRARSALLKRLADVVCLPSSRVNAFERAVTADLLVEMLREAGIEERSRVARRLSTLGDVPSILVRLLLRDAVEVSKPLLVDCATLGDADLVDCVRAATLEHRRLVALRRGVSEMVADALVESGQALVIEALLRNETAKLSHMSLELIVATTRDNAHLIAPLLRRAELRPSHAYVMFWWADATCRKTILQRFAVDRQVLQEAVSDIFSMAAEEGWQDPLSRKALQFIERRQRNRAALAKSAFASLDEAVAAAANGLTREIAEEIAYLSGLKPMTAAKIFTDPGGEPLAILCKATGLPRVAIKALWRGLRRREADPSGGITPQLERVMEIFDTVAVDRAQTVLRYWNWSLSSAMTPALMKAIREGDEAAIDEYSAPQKAAMLALSREFGR